jgi:putative flippase GtrA
LSTETRSNKYSIFIKYTVFAAIALGCNLLSQELTSRLYTGPYKLYVAIFVGTIAGLVVKYILDKHYIFRYVTQSAQQNIRLFALYTSMSVITTCIFWGTELAFDAIFQNKTMRYVGAAIGLTIGYITKYQLDKRFVFRKQA